MAADELGRAVTAALPEGWRFVLMVVPESQEEKDTHDVLAVSNLGTPDYVQSFVAGWLFKVMGESADWQGHGEWHAHGE